MARTTKDAGRTSRITGSGARQQAVRKALRKGYRDMAADEAAEGEALEWAEGTCGDVAGPKVGRASMHALPGKKRSLFRRATP